MKILITGGGGFVGRNLTQRLIDEGHQITITSTGSEPNLKVHKTLYMSLEGIDWRHVDKMLSSIKWQTTTRDALMSMK